MMKKITLLFILLAVSFGYSQTLPFDFSVPAPTVNWDASGGVGGAAIIESEQLKLIGNGNTWDNAYISFSGVDVVDLSDEAVNTISFTMKSTTAPDDEVHTHRIKLSGAGVYEVNWTTTGKELTTVYIDPPALGDMTELRIFIDSGFDGNSDNGEYLIDDIAVGANPATCFDGIMNQDETGIDCGGTICSVCDVIAPTAFTATASTIGGFSVELLLNATDESGGDITYDISYNAGANTAQATGASGVEEAYVVSGLMPSTAYTFDVTASDASGNTNVTTIMVPATTIADSSTPCAGFSSEAAEGAWSVGYNYSFVTEANGTDVTITFEILDMDKPDIIGEVFIPDPVQFIGMDKSVQTFTKTITGQIDGAVITFFGRFPYAGGLARTKEFSYTVGDNCSLGTKDFVETVFSLFPNPTKNSWIVKTENESIDSINVYDVLGKKVLSLAPNTNEATINGSSLKAGLYFAQIKTANGLSSLKLVKN